MPRKALSPEEIERREAQREKSLLDSHDAAAYLGVSVHTLDTWRATKRYPIKYLKTGGRVKYRKCDLDAWLESCVVAPVAA